MSGVRERLRFLESLFDDLERYGDPAPRLRADAGVLPIYWYRQEVNIQSYYRSKEESLQQNYDGWVVEIYNAARTGDLTAEAREEVRLTNAYRRMLGYTALVEAAKPIEAGMDEAAIVGVLDAATLLKRTPIRALRIDKRLVAAATAHARSMVAGKYFSHMAPSQAASAGGRSPSDRILGAGYKATGMSENLAAGALGGMQAHRLWRLHRPQHQILLGVWSDIGVGHVDRRWVQNVAIGDGGPMKPQPDLTPRRGSG